MNPTKSFPENKIEFECVEPELGARLSEYADPGLDPALRLRFEQHLEICHACRERVVIERGLGEILTEADFASRPLRVGRVFHLWPASGLALAAALVLAILLPPQNLLPDDRYRGDDDSFVITRPVEGEVLGIDGGALRWTELEDASAYRISLMSVEGEFLWEGETVTASLDLPAESEFEGDFFAAVEPVPADLHPPRETSVAFRRGSAWRVLGFRMGHPHSASLLTGIAALVLGFAAILRRR